jgi:FRG domain
MLIDAVGEALGDCVTENGRLVHAPSPWHGFFELWRRHADARARDGAVFFRGHNRVGLLCVAAGLYRDDISVESQRRARLAVDILAHVVERKEIISLKTDNPRTLARSIAQHYGVPTSLLDVTLDPAVAVFFATHGDVESP